MERVLKKLSKKDKKLYNQVLNKIDGVVSSYNLSHYKNLRYDFKNYQRVHIGHFVIIFKFDEKKSLIYFVDFEHHDNIYLKK